MSVPRRMTSPMIPSKRRAIAALLLGSSLTLSACVDQLDFDMRGGLGGGLDTAEAVRQPSADRPTPDARGVISYPGYQVAVAQQGDTVTSLATRVGLSAAEVARFNGLQPDATLRRDEVVALPTRVPAASSGFDIASIAGAAIDRAGPDATATTPATVALPHPDVEGIEPIRHKVERGETAFSIARLYNVSPRALAEWNGLGPDLAVRNDQYLIIPVPKANVAPVETIAAATEAPGQGSVTPVPPSAATPLPTTNTAAVTPPPSPVLADQTTPVTQTAALAMPTQGSIIRTFSKGRNEGIGIGAGAGAQVVAAEAGEVVAITQDTDQVQILVLRHANGLLTVYANVTDIKVARGARVQRGQPMAVVAAGDPAFLHFEVRDGAEPVDPVPYLS